MNPPNTENIYLPKVAVLDRVVDDIPEVKTFYWRFEDPAAQAQFKRFRPGQFAQISVFGVGEFPASLPPSPTEEETFFTIRQVGSCTAALHQPQARRQVRRARPLRQRLSDGGLLRQEPDLRRRRHRADSACAPASSMPSSTGTRYGRIQVFYGAKTPARTDVLPDLRAWEKSGGIECHLTVDRAADGWNGHVGVVGSLFKKPGVNVPVENTIAFVCGPPIMFRFVIKDLLALGFQERNIVSTLERYMKCGVGKCGHCCIGVAYICVDGPVFTYEQIKKLGEDI